MKISKRTVCIILGPVLFVLCYFCLPQSVFTTPAARAALGTLAWMALWWITGPIDFAVTAFLPMALNAIIPMADMSAVIANYSSETIILLLGASILTSSWGKTDLDRRIAAKCLALVGSKVQQQIAFWYIICTVLSSVLPNAVSLASMYHMKARSFRCSSSSHKSLRFCGNPVTPSWRILRRGTYLLRTVM